MQLINKFPEDKLAFFGNLGSFRINGQVFIQTILHRDHDEVIVSTYNDARERMVVASFTSDGVIEVNGKVIGYLKVDWQQNGKLFAEFYDNVDFISNRSHDDVEGYILAEREVTKFLIDNPRYFEAKD